MQPASPRAFAAPPVNDAPPALTVIDNNVVLDWLVFADPHGREVGAAIADGRLRWVATAAMHEELAHVLARGLGPRWCYDAGQVLARQRAACARHTAPVPRGPLTSRDPDDQKFVDLAVAIGATWLLTRDRALLRLAGRARPAGLAIVTPLDWRRRTGQAG